MTSSFNPYVEDELFGEDGKRSFHDDANKFYRDVMKLKTPLAAGGLPKCSKIKEAILTTPRDQEMNEILFNIRATPLENLWPGNELPPPHAMGLLWAAVHAAIPELPGETKKNEQTESDVVETAATVLAGFLDDKKGILLDESTYFNLLQDKGYVISKNKRPQKCYVVKDLNSSKGTTMAYRKIYDIGSMYYDVLKEHNKTFTKLPKNKSQLIQRVCKWILDNREYKGFSDVDDCDIRELVQNTADENGTDIPSHIYIYSQKFLFTKMFNMWTNLGIEKEEVTVNDRLRVIGVMLSPEYRDEMDSFTLGKAKNREELDDPSKRKKALFDKFAKGFNDENIVISQPQRFNKLRHSQKMDPNELSRIHIKRDGDWFGDVYKNVIKSYRKAMEKWTSGTGGGPGAPENYHDWRLRDEWDFQNYDRLRGNMLAWVYMKDKELNFILDAKNKDLPNRMIRETMAIGGSATLGNHNISSYRGNPNIPSYRRSPTGGMFGSMRGEVHDLQHFASSFMLGGNISSEEVLQINLENIQTLETMRDRCRCPQKRARFEAKIETLLERTLDEKPDVVLTSNSNNSIATSQRGGGSDVDSDLNAYKTPSK